MKERFYALDAFRGLCAIAVVLSHVRVQSSITETDFFRGSGIFVEFFFVLSGFVLAHGYGYNNKLSFRSFALSRLFRLYPLHLVMLFLVLVVECVKWLAYFKLELGFNNEPFTDRFDLVEFIPNLFLFQSWTVFTHNTSFNFPSWSISIELYMYMLLYATIVFISKMKQIMWFSISIFSFVLLSGEGYLLSDYALRGLSCFFGGAFVYSIYRKIDIPRFNVTISTILESLSVFLVILSVVLEHEERSLIATFVFFIVVPVFASSSGYISKILNKPFFQNLGKLSYSIYMTHIVLIFGFISIFIILDKFTSLKLSYTENGIRFLTTTNFFFNNLLVLVILISVIVFSSFTYRYIELKGLDFGKKITKL